MQSPFKVGDRVSIIPHRSKERDVIGVVTDPCKLTDMKRLDGTPVGFYVMVKLEKSDVSAAGYHASSLDLLT